jgi:hypothetical protein
MMTSKVGENNPMYGKHHTEEAKQRLREINTGKKLTEEQREKVRQSKLGKSRGEFSDEWRANMSAAHAGENNHMYGKTHSDDTKEKIRQKALGRVCSAESVARRSATLVAKGLKRERKICEHCGKDVAVNMYARYHGDNCKMKR